MLLEDDDSPGSAGGTKIIVVFQEIVSPFWANCGVSPFSTHMNIRVLSKAYE